MLASTKGIFMLIKQNVSRHIRVFWSVCHVETRKLLCVTPVTPAESGTNSGVQNSGD
jgi:hypothetical protein